MVKRLFVPAVLLASAAFAQQTSATLTGAITDPAGAAMPVRTSNPAAASL